VIGRARGTKLVVFDTSVLMALYERIQVFELLEDLLGEFECVVPLCVINELMKHLSSRSTRKSKAAEFALNIVKQRCSTVECIQVSEVDEAVVLTAKSLRAFIATLDQEMKKLARNLGVAVLYYRSSKNRFESFLVV